jgi:hypothetical protein
MSFTIRKVVHTLKHEIESVNQDSLESIFQNSLERACTTILEPLCESGLMYVNIC